MKKIILVLTLCFGINSYCQIDSKKPAGVLTTISYYIGSSNGCNDIWVGVISTNDNQSLLISSGVVHVGPGCKGKSNSTNSTCEDGFYKDDYIENSTSKEFKYCLIECLKYDDVYSNFESDKYRILSTIKK